MQVGERIRLLRKEKRLKQGELAELAEISRVAVGNYERGDRVPPLDIAARIAAALGVDVDFLLKGEGPKKGYSGTINLEGLTDKEIVEQGEKFIASTRRVYKAMDDATRVPLQLHEVFEKYGVTMQDYFDMMGKYDGLIESLSAEYDLTPEQFNNLLDDIRAIIEADKE